MINYKSVISTVLFLALIYHGYASDLHNEISAIECLNENKEPICITQGCVQAASDILKTIDESVDPCDDFYEFSCGTFIKDAVIPDDTLIVTKYQQIKDRMFGQLRNMVEEPIQPNEPRPFVLLKKVYHMCMDVDAIEKEALDNLKQILKKLGGWPIMEGSSWDESQFDWKKLVPKFREIGSSNTGFLRLSIGTDVHNSTRRILTIDEGLLLIKKEFLVGGFNNSIVQASYKYVIDYAVIYGADPEFAKKEAEDLMKFQFEFAQILINSEDRRNITALTNKMTISELQERFPTFPWLEFISNVMEHPNITITTEEVVDITVPSYIPKMLELINRTSKRIQANYLLLGFLNTVSSIQPKKIKNLEFELSKMMSGIEKLPPKWKECVSLSGNRMAVATAALFVRKYFSEKSKNNIIEMIDNLKISFVNDLKNLDWMDNETRDEAIKKVATIVSHVAYPQELLDDSKIEEFYAKLESSDNYIISFFNYAKFAKNYALEQFRKPINKTDWVLHSGSTAINAFYRTSENSIELPAGILQDVYFDKDRPQYLNYGGIGFIIGHEITHGFDDQGRQIDRDGLLRDWWSSETENTFLNKTKCIIDQYSNFSIANSNVTVNGINTQGENIADNGGLKVAYLAYQAWVGRNGKEPGLPGLKYTPNQLFWISLANIWCSKGRPEILEKLALIADHSPSNFRVIGPLRNSKYFADDFNCPIGSKMNPIKKCSVW